LTGKGQMKTQKWTETRNQSKNGKGLSELGWSNERKWDLNIYLYIYTHIPLTPEDFFSADDFLCSSRYIILHVQWIGA
jgi:hypothetical protein